MTVHQHGEMIHSWLLAEKSSGEGVRAYSVRWNAINIYLQSTAAAL